MNLNPASTMEEANEKKDAALSNNNSNILGYNVTAIQVGLVVADEFQAHAQQVARMARRLLPDRLQTIVLTPSLDPWPPTVLLIVCCSQPNFPSQRVSEYVKHKPVLVLTDLDLNRFLVDRRAFYQQLEVGGLALFLPRRALYRADDYDPGILIDRNDQIEVNGTILYKPVLERLNDPNSPKVRVYYPRRHGGGCKVLTFLEDDDDNASNDGFSVLDCTAKFESETRHLKKHEGGTWIYEEVADIEEIRTRKRQRKRDVVKSFVKKLSGVDSAEDNIFGDDDQVSFESDLSRLDRKIFVVTTAALPWMTGTAVNPLLRVAYLKRGRPTGFVTLVIPWLERESDRKAVYGDKQQFATPEEQEVFVRDWLRKQANMPEEADPATGLKIFWYPSRYYPALGSIFPTGDICKQIPDEDADFCILEEPEHLNWFRSSEHPETWTEKFTHVVGVIHTNYKAYASASAAIAAPIVSGLSTLMVRAYCDKVIKLSATLQAYSPEKEVVCNVHGVRSDFLEEGMRRAEASRATTCSNTKEQIAVDLGQGEEKSVAYFIGKLLWEKGLDRMLRLQYFYKEVTGEFFPIDIIGDGPDRPDIESSFQGEDSKVIRKILASGDDTPFLGMAWEAMAEQLGNVLEVPKSMQLQTERIPGQFHGRQDHANFCTEYKVIVNPSVTEVLCTTTAEALAMGKFAIIPKHPSNDFFLQFPNCLAYETKVEFVKNLAYALTNEPEPLTKELSYIFTWEAATERLMQSSAITMKEGRARAKARKEKQDDRIAKMYNKLGGMHGNAIQMVLQGGPEPGENHRWKFLTKKKTPNAESGSND